MVRCPSCGVEWRHAERRSHCTVCHRTFSSHRVGDAHRVAGKCRTDDEMAEKGFVIRSRDGWAEWGGKDAPADLGEKFGATA